MRLASISTLLFVLLSAAFAGTKTPNSWTVMVYMTAKNDTTLDCAALVDFAALANVGSVKGMQVFVELGRPVKPECGKAWAGTQRFHIGPGMAPTRGKPVLSPEAIMSRGASVRAFVKWVLKQKKFETDHYMLVMWGHGLGLKSVPLAVAAEAVPSGGGGELVPDPIHLLKLLPPRIPLGDFRSAGFDPDSGKYLYVRDVANQLAVDKIGRKLDVILLDSCLMGTIENAYAFRKVTDFLLASESIIFTGAWDYTALLRKATNPSAPAPLISQIHDTFAGSRKAFDRVSTASALKLSAVDSLARQVGRLGEQLTKQIMDTDPIKSAQFVQAMIHLRGKLTPFASPFNLPI